MYRGSVRGHPLTDKQKRFMEMNARDYYGSMSTVIEIVRLINSRERDKLGRALEMLCNVFSVQCVLTFGDCKDRPVSKVYPPFRTGYANAVRINLCTDVLGDAFNAIRSKQIVFDDPDACYARVSHLAIVFLHEFGHVMHKNRRPGPYGDSLDEERAADNWAVCFVNYYLT